MKKITIAALLAAGASTLAFAAIAAPHGHAGPGKMLEEVDTNLDGNITKEEIEAHKSAKKAEKFGAADTNGDNLVTFAEFEAYAEAEKARREAERRQMMFEMIDADGDGFVTSEEMQTAEGRRAKRGDMMFDRIDVDGDGILTEAEREAARAKMEQRRGEGRRGMRRGGR